MACRYYDDAIIVKLQKWVPENTKLKVLKPEETKRLFELKAEDSKEKPVKMPFIALSRNNEIELLSTVKSPKSYDGLKLTMGPNNTMALMNVIPIKLNYQLDIYTKKYDEGDEYLRTFLFKLINNPVIKIDIPYNGANIQHIANIRVQSSVSDTSDITEHLFAGQFTRWTIQFEIQDAFLFNIPYKNTWKIYLDDEQPDSLLELSEHISLEGEQEELGFEFRKNKD